MSENQHPAWNDIEPGARAPQRHHDMPPGEHAIELSKAISAKRTADALDQIAQHLAGIRLSAMRASGSDDFLGR